MANLLTPLIILLACPAFMWAISTVHHDKPDESKIPKMASKMHRQNSTGPMSERQKRLLPYINYYSNYQRPIVEDNNINHQQQFTPFLESNALPGSFVPMQKSHPRPRPSEEYVIGPPRSYQQHRPSYVTIYEKLARLKLVQKLQPPQGYQPQFNREPLQYFAPPPNVKTTINTYTPTDIDIDNQYDNRPNNLVYQAKPELATGPRYVTPYNYRKPIVFYHQPNKPKNTIIVTRPKPVVNTIVEDNFVAQKFTHHPQLIEDDLKQYQPVQFINNFDYNTQPPPSDNTNTLAQILKNLQDSNALPHTLTTDNIDNSIKTLVNILNGLKKKQQKLSSKPIVVADVPEEQLEQDDDQNLIDDPETDEEKYPLDTVEGGTPGRPGIDYPALSTIPQTDFNCKMQRYKGFFGDPNTNCQVWHYCDLNGGQASFLCPNGTIFSQVALTCDWWYNVKCANTAQLYVLNERLYKYILPLSPKFPEDYSGPLVDKYLALKFKEMEEKMNEERKKQEKDGDSEKDEGPEVEEKDDSDQLKDIIDQQNRSEKSAEDPT